MSRKPVVNGRDVSLRTIEMHVRMTPRMRELVQEKADEEGGSINLIVEKALNAYLMKDVADENLFLAKLSDVERSVDRMKHDLELMQKLELEKLQYEFLWAPEIDKTTMAARTATANKNVQNMLSHFRKRVTQIRPLRDTLFGELLEEDANMAEGGR